MLNPSTADENQNDPTVERCQRRAGAMGYGGLVVTNIFAYRSTDPAELRRVDDPIGPDNDEMIAEAASRAAMVVCAWGSHGDFLGRGNHVRELLRSRRVTLHYLNLSQGGHPGHPLYISYRVKPTVWV